METVHIIERLIPYKKKWTMSKHNCIQVETCGQGIVQFNQALDTLFSLLVQIRGAWKRGTSANESSSYEE